MVAATRPTEDRNIIAQTWRSTTENMLWSRRVLRLGGIQIDIKMRSGGLGGPSWRGCLHFGDPGRLLDALPGVLRGSCTG